MEELLELVQKFLDVPLIGKTNWNRLHGECSLFRF